MTQFAFVRLQLWRRESISAQRWRATTDSDDHYVYAIALP